jgi:hypothetical protein
MFPNIWGKSICLEGRKAQCWRFILLGWRMKGAEYKVRDAGYRMQDAEFRM